MANILTGIRILCGILIMCFPAFSSRFYFFYLIGGLTDAVDGTVARKRGEASAFGAKFDTVADFVFAIAVAYTIVKNINIPMWLVIWILIIVIIKITSHLAGYFKYHEFRTVHSAMNKLCGAVTFIVPLLIGGDYALQAKVLAVIVACILASVGAILEAVTILKKQL